MEYSFLLILFGFITLIFASLFVIYLSKYRRSIQKIDYLISAAQNGDFTFNFSEKRGSSLDRYYNKSLNLIRDLLLMERGKIAFQEHYYSIILDRIDTGILTINLKGEILLSNSAAKTLLNTKVLTHSLQLNRVSKELYSRVEGVDTGEPILLSLDCDMNRLVSVRSVVCDIKGEKIKIVSIRDIEKEMDYSQLNSWSKLTHVMTHEVMNLITPIISISDTLLNGIIEVKSMDGDIVKNIADGVGAINSTSKDLLKFVTSYRALSSLPSPVLCKESLTSLLEEIVSVNEATLNSNGVIFLVDKPDSDLLINIDRPQILRVIYNLINNALYSIVEIRASLQRPYISISSKVESSSLIIYIQNNGPQIPRDIKEQIFVPFFTSKEGGSGIGLSISKQIMLLHGGALKLKSTDHNSTTFSIEIPL
jgi:nitrogen fixation/metabolism regulation signal transduction histidine kinase